MRLIEIGPDDDVDINAFVAVENAAHGVDAAWEYPRTPYRLEMAMRHGWDGEPGRYFMAYDEHGVPVGAAEIETSNHDNLELAWLSITVRPDHRRRGHGRAMATSLFEICREMNRPLVGTHGPDNAATTGFAAAVGFEPKTVVVQRRLPVTEVPAGAIDELHGEAATYAADYELLRISGRTPDHLLQALAESTAAINDAPLDDLEYEDEVFTPDRIRDYEVAQIDGGHRFYRIIAVHRATGEIGGLTVVSVDVEQPALGEQHDTSVVRAHRGHRLGVLLKTDMVRWLAVEEPQLRTMDTQNAESNSHMVSVNERLGYLVMERDIEFQLRLDRPGSPGLVLPHR